MIRGNDFILNPDKLQEEFQLVEVSDWVDFSTKEKLGFYYTVLLPKLKFEKVKVGIKANQRLLPTKNLNKKGRFQSHLMDYILGLVSIMDVFLSKQKLPISEKWE